jgi:chromosome segregation ATPase
LTTIETTLTTTVTSVQQQKASGDTDDEEQQLQHVDYYKSRCQELENENGQMKTAQAGLKLQLVTCEETNLQMAAELDAQMKRTAELERGQRELSSRLKLALDENNEMRKQSDQCRLRLAEVTNQNAFLNTNLKDSLAKLDSHEAQIGQLTAQQQEDKLEIRRLFYDLSVQKERKNELQKLNESLEQQLSEVQSL